MKTRSRSRASRLVALACACIGAGVTAHAQQAVEIKPNLVSIAHELERARDIQEIQNLMTRRMYFHSVGQNENELALWSRKREVRWAQNQGCFVGIKSIAAGYDIINRKNQQAEIERLSKLNPKIVNGWSSRFVGNTVLHTLNSPLIVVADDLQSAKATWYTPGVILTTQDGKTPIGFWIWERYAIDVVSEDGQWRFLNIQVNTDFMNPMGKSLQPQGSDAAALGVEGVQANGPQPAFAIPGPDIAKQTYREFGATRVPTITPRQPEPYRTLSETFQYADCSGG
jgi:hypothetical protein